MANTKQYTQHRRQAGFTLVELMISLVIGLLLTTGILQVYLSNKEAYRTNEALARVQEDSRLLTDMLGRNIRMTGYRMQPESKREQVFPDTSVYMGSSSSGQVVAVTSNSSTIGVVYQSDGNTQSCLVTEPAAGTLVKTALSYDSGTKVLTCKSAICPASCSDRLLTNIAGSPLVEGVDALTFSYGIDTTGDGSANRYVATVTETDRVASVRVQYTLESRGASTAVYDAGTSKRKKLSKTYTTTIALRNIVP